MASRNMTMLYGLGGRIRETREQHGLSLTDLSVAVGSDKSALSKIEKGERVPTWYDEVYMPPASEEPEDESGENDGEDQPAG